MSEVVQQRQGLFGRVRDILHRHDARRTAERRKAIRWGGTDKVRRELFEGMEAMTAAQTLTELRETLGVDDSAAEVIEMALAYEQAVTQYLNAVLKLAAAQKHWKGPWEWEETYSSFIHDSFQELTHLHDILRTGRWPRFWRREMTPSALAAEARRIQDWAAAIQRGEGKDGPA